MERASNTQQTERTVDLVRAAFTAQQNAIPLLLLSAFAACLKI